MEDDAFEEGTDGVDLIPCQHCGRKFRAEAHEKHLKICVKVFCKQRKAFDPTKKRMPQEALEQLQQSKRKGGKRAGAAAGDEAEWKSKWKLKSKAFRQAMQQAKMVTHCQAEGKPLPPPVATAPELDDRIQCPCCGRRFAQQAADRHIPFCKQQKAKAKGNAKSAARPRR